MSRTTILVFGEDRAVRMDARRTLLASGYPVRVASSMAEAAKAINAGDVELIVLALAHGHSDGLIDQLRSAFTLPLVHFEAGEARTITELVRTAVGAHEASRNQDGESE